MHESINANAQVNRTNRRKDGMPRGKHPEIYIMLWLGVKPQVLVQQYGYSEQTVYKYNNELPKMLKLISDLLTDRGP